MFADKSDRGFLFYADTPSEVVEQIRYIAAHRGQARAMALKGCDVVARDFTWPVLAGEFLRAVGGDPAAS